MSTVDEPGASPSDRLNDALVSAVNDAFETDPIPRDLTQFALDAFAWRVIDEELAAITYDSATTELVGIRGTASQRHSFRFEGRGVAVSVSLSGISVVVSVEPAGRYSCRIESPSSVTDTVSDDEGQFVVDHRPLPVRVVVETPAGRLVSPWIIG